MPRTLPRQNHRCASELAAELGNGRDPGGFACNRKVTHRADWSGDNTVRIGASLTVACQAWQVTGGGLDCTPLTHGGSVGCEQLAVDAGSGCHRVRQGVTPPGARKALAVPFQEGQAPASAVDAVRKSPSPKCGMVR